MSIFLAIAGYFLFATPFAIGLGKYLKYTRRRQTVRARVPVAYERSSSLGS